MAVIQESLFGKMYPEHSAAVTDKILGQSSKKSWTPKFQCLIVDDGLPPEWSEGTGVVLHGESLMRNIGESPNVVKESFLSQISEDNVPEKYYLSPKACLGILRRAEKRGKKLPPLLEMALRNQAGVPEQEGKSPQQSMRPTEQNGTEIQEQTQATISSLNQYGPETEILEGGDYKDAGHIVPVVHPQITGTLCASGAGLSRPAGMGSETDLIVCRPVAFGPGGQPFAPIAFNGRQDPISGPMPGALDTDPLTQCIAYPEVVCRNLVEKEEISGTLQAKAGGGYSLNYINPVRVNYVVRRLMPVECLRLQGFPDDWLDLPGTSDSATYKATGNSIAIPPVRWIMCQIVSQVGAVNRNKQVVEVAE